MSLRIYHTVAELRAALAGERRTAFVPTMGNLHAGHVSLVHAARARADRVVASIFVNPTQFGPNEDFQRYPRTPGEDAAKLAEAGCDLLWAPDVATMYPLGVANAVQVRVPGITDVLEGAHRPGHFDGVATVVARLLLQVQPDVAVFGRKDYQQLAVIRHLVADLAFPVEIVAGDTVRAADDLALSSRNQYLDAKARALAPRIHAALLGMVDAVRADAGVAQAEAGATAQLEAAGFTVDYMAVRRRDLQPAGPDDRALVALAAARLGSTRLIDNIEFERAAGG